MYRCPRGGNAGPAETSTIGLENVKQHSIHRTNVHRWQPPADTPSYFAPNEGVLWPPDDVPVPKTNIFEPTLGSPDYVHVP
jgi:hypothetical protein